MESTKIFGAILIVLSLVIGYVGIKKITDNTVEVNLLGLKIDASNESGKQQGYFYFGSAVLLLAGGIFVTKYKK